MTAADYICRNPDEALLDAVTELRRLLEYLGGERRGDVEGITTNATDVSGSGSGSGVATTVPVSTRRTRSNSVMTVDSVQSQGQGLGQGLGPGQQISQARKKQKVMGGGGGGGEENDDDVTYWQEAPSPSPALLLSSTTALGTRRPRSSLQSLLQDILARHAAKGQGLAGGVNILPETGIASSSSASAIAAGIQAPIVPSRLSAAVLAFYATNLTPIIPSSSSSSIDGVSALTGGRQGHGWFSINEGALLRKVWCDVAYLHLLPLHQCTSTKGNPPPLNTTGAVVNVTTAMKWIVMCASLDMACLSMDSQSTAPSSSSSSLSSYAVDVTPHLVELEQKGALLVQVLRLLELLINVVSLSSSTSASSSAVEVQKFQPLLSSIFIHTFSSHLLNPSSQPNLNSSSRIYHP